MKSLKRYALMLAKPNIVFYTMIWLMIVLILGTVAQKYIGLYRAQNLFFYSWVIWMGGFVPLPGGLTTLGFLTASMTAKLFLASKWTAHNVGTIVTHIGVLLLLYGGLLTYAQSQDGNMVLFEGDTASHFTDYHERELIVEIDGKTLSVFPWKVLHQGAVFTIPDTPLKIEIVKLCRNCAFVERQKPSDELRGRARNFDIAPAPPEKDDEANRSALQFRISGASNDQNGVYFSTDFIDVSPSITVGDKTYSIALRKKRTSLPFEIQLVEFQKTVYPGTNIAKNYQSEVILRENGTEWRSLIKMNAPLRYRGYTFFQSSFIEDNGKEATVLAVVKNMGRMFPYISSIVMCLGLLVHLFAQLPKLVSKNTVIPAKAVTHEKINRHGRHVRHDNFEGLQYRGARSVRGGKKLGWLLLFLSVPLFFVLTNTPKPSPFSQIPILDQGRVKPMDTFARSTLEIMSGKDTVGETSAIDWLAELIFTPDAAYGREVFNVASPAVRDALALPERRKYRYSYREISAALYNHPAAWQPLFETPPENLTPPQKQLLELFDKITTYAQLSRSLSLLFPDFEGESYFILLSKIPELENDKNAEKILAQLHEREKDSNSAIFRVIPPQWAAHGDVWFAPWEMGAAGAGSPEAVKFLKLWNEMLIAYRAKNTTQWMQTAADVRTSSNAMSAQFLPKTLVLETLFNTLKPFAISFYLYGAAFAAILASYLFRSALSLTPSPLIGERDRRATPDRERGVTSLLYFFAFSLLLAAIVFNVVGLGVRMMIMQRPPVTNLYGSIVFVSLIAALGGAMLETRLKNSLGIIIAAVLGAFLQLVGMKFDAEGDTMGQLVAVLDTNFWLGTHVVMMTTGYGCCLVGGIIGHVYLIRRLVKPADRQGAGDLFRIMRGVALVAMFFTALGTILGGIWADQSWGRFWGWDPKENGALLIVLWLIWMLHGRLSGKLGELGFSAASALTLVVVALAWFGVNLLGVGLHSYGFTQNAAASFIIFCAIEILLIGVSYAITKSHDSQNPLLS
jgi:ABC-type transport system involved in cytochrome c biogenesis permease subunit